MRYLEIYIAGLLALGPSSSLGLVSGSSPLRDLDAYPKYEVQFLNTLPLAQSDAEGFRSFGVQADEEWLELRPRLSAGRRLEAGRDRHNQPGSRSLLPLSLTPPGAPSQEKQDYLCLLPSRNATEAQLARLTAHEEEEESHTIDPAESWAALSHLEGKCLYLRHPQAWFTYSYCHNSHIRQFREAQHAHPHPPGGRTPEEDPHYDAYTLGLARPPPSRKPGSNHPDPRRNALTPTTPQTAVDRDHSSSRYLSQKWSDGTICDKTRRPREIEVQVHCSMTTGDSIYLIKELAICQYVMIIHSPHLCGLPGFRNDEAGVQGEGIRCRRVVPDEEMDRWDRTEGGQGQGQGQQRLGLPEGFERAETQEDPGMQVEQPAPPREMSLKEMLQKAIEVAAEQQVDLDGSDLGEADEVDEDVMLLAWDEGEDGAVLVDADVLLGREGVEDEEREEILNAVRDFLARRQGGRQRDEL